MKRYKSIFKEDINTNANELAEKIQEEIQKIFPKSFVSAKFTSNIYPNITVIFTLGKDKSEWNNGIQRNDPAYHAFMIGGKSRYGISNEGEIKESLVCEEIQGSTWGFYIKSKEGSYNAMDRFKLPFRKVTSTPDKIIEVLKKYFLLLKTELKKNKDNMMDYHLQLIGDKF